MAFFNKKNQFEAIRNPLLYEDDQYPLSYRLIILHGIWYSCHNKEDVNTLDVVKAMQNVIFGLCNHVYFKKCLELYKFSKNQEEGFILVDRSKACYPLIFYPPDGLPGHGNRVSALSAVLNDLHAQNEFFDVTLRGAGSWNTELVDNLKGRFKKPSSKIS